MEGGGANNGGIRNWKQIEKDSLTWAMRWNNYSKRLHQRVRRSGWWWLGGGCVVVVGGWVVVGFFCFFVFLALFIDLLTDKVRFLSSSGSGVQCLGSNGPSDHCRMQPHFDCAWSRKKQWW